MRYSCCPWQWQCPPRQWVDCARAGDAAQLKSAVVPDRVPAAKQTPQALYVTAREAFEALQARGDVLLIDVRTPGETVFSGLASQTTRNIPYLVIEDGHAFDADAHRYKLVANPDFPKAVEQLIAARKLGPDAVLILYCSYGDRSAKAASLLANSGYGRVYSIVDGFEGDPRSPRPADQPGWKDAGLPWSFDLTEDQAYHSPTF